MAPSPCRPGCWPSPRCENAIRRRQCSRPQPAQTPPASSSCRSSFANGARLASPRSMAHNLDEFGQARIGAAPGWPEGAARHWPLKRRVVALVIWIRITGSVAWQHLLGAPFPGVCFLLQNQFSRALKHRLQAIPFPASRTACNPTPTSFGGSRAKTIRMSPLLHFLSPVPRNSSIVPTAQGLQRAPCG